jgi:hypothetical protein
MFAQIQNQSVPCSYTSSLQWKTNTFHIVVFFVWWLKLFGKSVWVFRLCCVRYNTKQTGFRFEQTLNNNLLDVLIVVILRYFNKSMYILVLTKGCSYPWLCNSGFLCIDGVLLRMVVLTETCKGWRIKKNTVFISHTGQWLQSCI